MAEHAIKFSEYKLKVGIDDIAYSLGYRLNKKAGVGKRFELVLGPLDNPTDVIIVKNTEDKKDQTYFRRNDTKGDVITFIKENISSFNVEGINDWVKVANVLAKFANMPPVEDANRKAVEYAKTHPHKFDIDRYHIEPLNAENPHWLLSKRGLNKDTVSAFLDCVVLIKDKKQKNFDGFNIGFPYKNTETGEITGFEIRGGNGFKSKAAGTDSSKSFWSAEFGGSSSMIRNVYLFESSFDAMAFYQINKVKINLSPFAVVSMGGTFSQQQVEGVIKKYPSAKLWDCFDNDLAGNVYSKNLVVQKDKIPLDIQYKNDANGNKIAVLTNGLESVERYADSFKFKEAAKELGIKYSIGHWKAPSNYKDWNDCLLGKKIEYVPTLNKHDRNQHLAEQRQTSVKL